MMSALGGVGKRRVGRLAGMGVVIVVVRGVQERCLAVLRSMSGRLRPSCPAPFLVLAPGESGVGTARKLEKAEMQAGEEAE